MADTPGSRLLKRWMAAKNESDIDIPPFAVVQIKDYGKDGNDPDQGPFGSFKSDLEMYWKVERPGKLMAVDQNPGGLFINSGKIIEAKGGRGSVTRDFPALTLHNPVMPLDKLVPGQPCGPVEDQFYLQSSGHAFTCMGHDENSWEGGDPLPEETHTIWVTEGHTSLNPSRARGAFLSSLVAAGDYFFVTGDFTDQDEKAAGFDPFLAQYQEIEKAEDDSGFSYLLITKPGLYLVSFDATISADMGTVASDTNLEVQALVIRANADTGDDETAWQIKASVPQRIIQFYQGSSFPLTLTKQAAIPYHLSMCHPGFFYKGDKLYFKNNSSVDLTIGPGQASVTNMATRNFKPATEDEPTPGA